VLLSAVTTPVRASVQTGEPPNLAREGDPIGLTAEAGAGAGGTPLAGSARPNHGLTTVVTGHGLRYPVEISENSPEIPAFRHGEEPRPRMLKDVNVPCCPSCSPVEHG
jgi:hypothetical protein